MCVFSSYVIIIVLLLWGAFVLDYSEPLGRQVLSSQEQIVEMGKQSGSVLGPYLDVVLLFADLFSSWAVDGTNKQNFSGSHTPSPNKVGKLKPY